MYAIALKIIVASSLWGQTFVAIATDTQADNINGFPDLRSVAVAFKQDSLLARIEFHEALGEDYGIIMAFNTDGNQNNGKYLQQDSLDFRWDTRVVVSRNAIFQPTPEGFAEHADNGFLGGVRVSVISARLIELAIALEDIEFQQNAEVVIASAGFDIAQAPINDVMPNEGTARLQTTHIAETVEQKIRFQQPVEQQLRIIPTAEQQGLLAKIQITDISGKNMLTQEIRLGEPCNVSFLSSGVYILSVNYNNITNNMLFMKL